MLFSCHAFCQFILLPLFKALKKLCECCRDTNLKAFRLCVRVFLFVCFICIKWIPSTHTRTGIWLIRTIPFNWTTCSQFDPPFHILTHIYTRIYLCAHIPMHILELGNSIHFEFERNTHLSQHFDSLPAIQFSFFDHTHTRYTLYHNAEKFNWSFGT